MADLNLCVFVGRLGKDPELKHMQNGDAVCNTSIAVGRRWKDKSSGEMKEQTTWVPLSFWGKSAELLGQYAKKGAQMRVTGELNVRKYTDKEGMEKTVTEIRVTDFQLLGAKPEGQQQAAPKPKPAQQSTDDDIPF